MTVTYTQMVEALRRKFPDKHISITKSYDRYSHIDDLVMDHKVYVEEVHNKHHETFLDLERDVEQLLKRGS